MNAAGVEGERSGGETWARVQDGAKIAGRALGRAVMDTGRAVNRWVRTVDPGVYRFLAQGPLLGLTHLSRNQTPPPVLPEGDDPVVVFVHGLGGHRGNFLPMGAYFSMLGRRRWVTVGFDEGADVEQMADALVAYVDQLYAVNAMGSQHVIEIVGHSLGGIIARLALEDAAFRARVRRLVTLGSPHRGTDMARWLRSHTVERLRTDSALVARLCTQLPWDTTAGYPPMTCLWSASDLLISPPENATLEGAHNIHLPDATHLSFVTHPRAWHAVYEVLTPRAAERESTP